MKYLALTMVLASLAACGVDGKPLQPVATANVTLTGNGPQIGGAVGVRKGPLSILLGL